MDMNAAEESLRSAIVAAARRMEAAGHSPGTSGNISARLDAGFLITPSGVEAAKLAGGDIVALDRDGTPRPDQRTPSTEWPMHAALYRTRPDIRAVVHCHSRFATILSCTRRGIPALHYMIALTSGHEIPCAPYETFGTQALSHAVVRTLGHGKACLMANHGQIALGHSLDEALRIAEEVERLAHLYWAALAIGGPVVLTEAEMADVAARFLSGYGQPQ